MGDLSFLPSAIVYVLAGWLIAGCVLGLLGGFATVRRVASGAQARTWHTRLTTLILYPVILLRAALWAMWEVTIGGAR